MPLYAVTTEGSDKLRLIDAASESAALKHAAIGTFSARRVTKPTEVATLCRSGATVEKAGEAPTTPEDGPKEGDWRVNVQGGMIETFGADGAWSESRPATLDELQAAEPGATFRVDAENGVIKYVPSGGSDELDIRDATPEEMETAHPTAPSKAKK